ncbi:MAG: uracil-DNA glycosylase family protein [Bacteroidia bacterium]|nr:uracil-DNA glycosylase family protein [Bacteroidia bacterium]
MQELLNEIKQCTICEEFLPLGPRPVVVAKPNARVIIIGQAPGTKVHNSGIPWDDASGKQLRLWLNMDDDTFYNSDKIAIVPMGFCYPGKGKSGDLPPRKECAPQWHQSLFGQMPKLELKLLIGQYAQKYYLGDSAKANLTKTVQAWKQYAPEAFPLPHPSPRNRLWLKKNPWFDDEVVPRLQERISKLMGAD